MWFDFQKGNKDEIVNVGVKQYSKFNGFVMVLTWILLRHAVSFIIEYLGSGTAQAVTINLDSGCV